MAQSFKFEGFRDPMTLKVTHYLEYQVLMFTGAFSYYKIFYILINDFSWPSLILWAWASLMQFFYMQRSYDRLEIKRRHDENKWYEWIFYTAFSFLLIYCVYKGIDIEVYLNSMSNIKK
jgi:hypothetical protein